jgi:hypothetical protein
MTCHAIASMIHRLDRDWVTWRWAVAIERSSRLDDQSFNFRSIAPKKLRVSQQGSNRLSRENNSSIFVYSSRHRNTSIVIQPNQLTRTHTRVRRIRSKTSYNPNIKRNTEPHIRERARDHSTSLHRLDGNSACLFLVHHLVVLERFGALEPPGGEPTLVELVQLLVGSALSLISG